MEQIVFRFQIDFTASMQSITMLDQQIEAMAKFVGDDSYKSRISDEFRAHMREVTNKTASLAYPTFKDLWYTRITTGHVEPALSDKYLDKKVLSGGSPNPLEGPDQEFASNSGLGEVTDDSIEFIVDSNVLPSWHGASWYVEPTLAEGVPIRRVIDEQEANSIIYEQFYAAYESVEFGDKVPKPEKMTFSVSSNVSVASSDSAGNDKLKKRKNKKLRTASKKSNQVNRTRKTTAKKNEKLTRRG